MAEDPRHAAWRSEFEKLGEVGVRMIDPGSHVIPDDRIRFSRVWLEELASSKRDIREAETLSIAKEANEIARTASFSATAAAAAASEANDIARSVRDTNRRSMWISIVSAAIAAISAIVTIKYGK